MALSVSIEEATFLQPSCGKTERDTQAETRDAERPTYTVCLRDSAGI